MNTQGSQRSDWSIPLWLGIYAFITLGVFSSALSVSFLSDDWHMLHLAQYQTLPWQHLFTHNLEGTQTGSSYGPVFRLVWEGLAWLFGTNPVGYHALTLLLHTLNGWLVFLLARLVGRVLRQPSLVWAAPCAGGLFLLMHSRAEAVLWFASFPHVFGTTMLLTAVYYSGRCFAHQTYSQYWLAHVCWTLGLFTKEIVITFPLLFWLIACMFSWRTGRTMRKNTITTIIFSQLVLLGVYLALRAGATGQVAGFYASATVPLGQMVEHYLSLLVGTWVPVSWRTSIVQFLLLHPLGTLLGLGIMMWQLVRRKAVASFLFLWLTLLTALPFVMVAMHPVTQEGDRYTYLVSGFAVLFMCSLCAHMWKKQVAAMVLGLLIVGQLGLVTSQLSSWTFASQRVQKLLASAHDLELSTDDQLIAVGLPDNYAGAQGMRNGIGEALSITLGFPVQVVERIPLYVQLVQPGEAALFSLDQHDGRLAITGPAGWFTGFPVYESAFVTAELLNFRQPGHMGDGIGLIPTETAIAAGNDDVFLLWSDGVVLRSE